MNKTKIYEEGSVIKLKSETEENFSGLIKINKRLILPDNFFINLWNNLTPSEFTLVLKQFEDIVEYSIAKEPPLIQVHVLFNYIYEDSSELIPYGFIKEFQFANIYHNKSLDFIKDHLYNLIKDKINEVYDKEISKNKNLVQVYTQIINTNLKESTDKEIILDGMVFNHGK